MTLYALILVCSVSTPKAQCDESTAYSVTRGQEVAMPSQCLMGGEVTMSKTPLVDAGQYIKIVCGAR